MGCGWTKGRGREEACPPTRLERRRDGGGQDSSGDSGEPGVVKAVHPPLTRTQAAEGRKGCQPGGR